jgi:hypothetical protein
MLKDKLFEHLSKGIPVKTLRELVHNTAPFIFNEKTTAQTRYIEILTGTNEQLTVKEYFELCIAAHFATVGTFVPTDVDLAIRQKLWMKVSTPEDFEPMWDLVKEFATWDESLVSRRWRVTPSGLKISGHHGEWFSIAMGAYGIAVKKVHAFVPEVRTAIESLVKDQERVLGELRELFVQSTDIEHARAYLDAIAAVAHNLGDLDRMFDAWEIGDVDVLKRRVYRCGHEDARNPRPEFLLAGKIYKEMLANENHRHFPLREPKGIRKSGRFLLNFGPFLDDWGADLVKASRESDPLLSEGDLREVAAALIQGWKRLNPKSIYSSQGYARALCGMASAYPNKLEGLESLLSPALKKQMNESGVRTMLNVSRNQFEKQWVQKLKTILSQVSD